MGFGKRFIIYEVAPDLYFRIYTWPGKLYCIAHNILKYMPYLPGNGINARQIAYFKFSIIFFYLQFKVAKRFVEISFKSVGLNCALQKV